MCTSFFFLIALHKKDEALLKAIQNYFGGVVTVKVKGDKCSFIVSSLSQITKVIIPHFDSYPLITNKLADYSLWKGIIEIMKVKNHLTVERLNEIVQMKAQLNLGLSEELKTAFTETFSTSSIIKRILNKEPIPNGMWMAGFTSGVGSFFVNIFKSAHHKVGYQIRLELEIAQHIRDELLMLGFTKFFGCGIISRY